MLVEIMLGGSLFFSPLSAQCHQVQDSDKRGFTDLKPIVWDIDNDGRPDKITPRLIVTPYRDKKSKLHHANWIVFNLETSKGGMARSFFKYRYGTDNVNYWVWALVPCKANKLGRKDLLFYSGDDTSHEMIWLLNTGGKFKVHSRKTGRSDI